MLWTTLGQVFEESIRSIFPICGLAAVYGAVLGYRGDNRGLSQLWPTHILVAVAAALAMHCRGVLRLDLAVPDGPWTFSIAALLTLVLTGTMAVVWLAREPRARMLDVVTLWTAALAGMAAGAQMGRVSVTIAVVFMLVFANCCAEDEATEEHD